VDYRSSDRQLDEQIVSGLIAVQFPDLACGPVTRLGAGWDHEPWAELRTELAAAAGRIGPLLDPDLRSRAEPYLAGLVTEPDQDGRRRFIHNDICPDHLIVDPGTGRLTGLIDFTDAMVGEPVLDFAGPSGKSAG
jgi:Ser/Thr protein kinase RdoA (MazF antagonist)